MHGCHGQGTPGRFQAWFSLSVSFFCLGGCQTGRQVPKRAANVLVSGAQHGGQAFSTLPCGLLKNLLRGAKKVGTDVILRNEATKNLLSVPASQSENSRSFPPLRAQDDKMTSRAAKTTFQQPATGFLSVAYPDSPSPFAAVSEFSVSGSWTCPSCHPCLPLRAPFHLSVIISW